MEIVPVYRFERVEKVLLDAVSSTEGVLDTPNPFVLFKGQGDSCQIFEVAFFINNYSKRAVLWQAAWRRIWRHLEQAGIQMATPQREIFLPPDIDKKLSSPVTILENCGEFSTLTDEEKKLLAKKAQFQHYSTGEIILSPAEADTPLLIIIEGVISLGKKGQHQEHDKRLGVADVFGLVEDSDQLEIIARTDTEVMFIDKKQYLEIKEKNSLQ